MSSKEEYLKKQAKMMRQPVPDRIKNKPKLGTGLQLYYDAFMELQNDRNEAGFIPWTVKTQYADRFKFSELQYENLNYFLNKLCGCYSEWLNKRRGSKHGDPT